MVRGSWGCPAPPRSLPMRGVRGVGNRLPPPTMKRLVRLRDRRPVVSMPSRGRPVAPPPRSYDRRASVPSYTKGSLKREYSRCDELPHPRSRVPVDYGSRVVPERRTPYRDDYSSRGPGYSDPARSTSRMAPRRAYVDDAYGQRFEQPPPPPPGYHEGHACDYDSISGSKRPYFSLVGVHFFIVECHFLSFAFPQWDYMYSSRGVGGSGCMGSGGSGSYY